MHLLVPYVRLSHPDPAFGEFTYGDSGQRGRKLKSDVKKGDYIFFHTSKHGKKYITAYYVVDRILNTSDACQDQAIRAKFKNPHIEEWLAGEPSKDDDVIVFGDPITSHVLEKPLLFDKNLAENLSLDIKFQANKPAAQIISWATRAWRKLSDQDVVLLLEAVVAQQENIRSFSLLSSEEVAETLERDIERYIARNPTLLGKGLTLIRPQKAIGDGRLDLLFENSEGNWIIVEIKYNRIGREAIQQIKRYTHDLRKETNKIVTGVIVCAGVMPAYKDEIKAQKDVQVFVYGWDLSIEKWRE